MKIFEVRWFVSSQSSSFTSPQAFHRAFRSKEKCDEFHKELVEAAHLLGVPPTITIEEKEIE